MDSRPHASIGEVLGELQVEFPDITISKIRFLESQGLIDPERTASGYRKFYEDDVARLRWILVQQKDNFLPLKVIKERLAEMDAEGVAPGAEAAPPKPRGTKRKTVAELAGEPAAAPAPKRRRKQRVDMPELPLDDTTTNDLDRAATGASLNRAELVKASGLTDYQLAELESYGLIAPMNDLDEQGLFDEDALVIAKNAAGFFRRGIEARHLRMYRSFAERETGLFQQVVLPLLKQRNPEARKLAHEEIGDLAKHGRALRAAYLRMAAAELLDE